MPRSTTTQYKYRCQEPACGMTMRNDKWKQHCRERHAAKFNRNGFQDWKNGARNIQAHEISKEHRDSELCKLQWRQNTRIDISLALQKSARIVENRSVMNVMIDSVLYLASEMMALRGHDAKDGKFYNLFRMLAKYSVSASNYLTTLSNHQFKPDLNFLSRLNQSRLLNVIKDRVVNTIVKRIGKNPWTITLDSTQDTSKKEAVVILVRYLETNDEGRVFPVELNKLQLDYSTLVGQAYDGANNMSGGITGLQARLHAKAPHALYVWCRAHRLNLVSTQAMSCTTEMKNCIGVLGELHSSNEKTVLSANGLTKQLRTLKFATCLFILRQVFNILGPALTCLQGVAVDLSITSSLLNDTANRLQTIQSDVKQQWSEVLDKSKHFAEINDLNSSFGKIRHRKRKQMVDEFCEDESVSDMNKKLQVEVYIPVLDNIIDRFDENTVQIYKCTGYFSVKSLLTSHDIQPIDISALCDFYSLDKSSTAKELNKFRKYYKSAEKLVDVSDMLPTKYQKNYADFECQFVRKQCGIYDESNERNDDNNEHQDSEDDENGIEKQIDTKDRSKNEITANSEIERTIKLWFSNSFTKPLRVLWNTSGYPHLMCIYKILTVLPVTSCSAERALSKVTIVKYRLRSTMIDDWFASLVIIASEKDIVNESNREELIDDFAMCSNALKKELLQ
ncbi:unnamed protein product [Didymodactylos carnosus]|uniref:Uncharacterized protein n=1 Tax=Didymodactylos carnosus TaxID=1234261 RepID=A0A814IZN4_9BILA|nr:unnamed protein product [Didymodactylos carnosus]CAF3801989.1 unnamed protein product [Didymodactylos carnosus]